ncbi:MAG TPA: hypothetical protein VN922_08885 [Bacteroidia bacterium]|nr:hypothetical protein [Bacteroidia bacterium]
MKKLFFLVLLLVGCYYSPKRTNPDSKKMETVNVSDTTTFNKGTSSNNQKTKTASVIDTTTLDSINGTAYTSLRKALLKPDRVISLHLSPSGEGVTPNEIKHLPTQIGTLTNLKELQISCLEYLQNLPSEIGNLKSLERLIINNGNGCMMNVSIPTSIGNLTNLKELTLYGAIDNSFDSVERDTTTYDSRFELKELPQTIASLQNLEVLDLGRNGLKKIPPQVFVLHKLRILRLDYNSISEIPSSISNLINLEELSLVSITQVKLPKSMKTLKGLKVFLGYRTLEEPSKKELADEEKLKEEFPNIIFSFSYAD